ncbi:ArsJ-associated glyceraldehyde-3-phosphate dehydrogenase [Thioalkalivibrio sp. ALMg3]|uniref:ArsJ-associated glyceraldehyde-3-phosphate dehydrogenase n=1 Tax=Thioalkalivibrio sp. ALMg3 TaxID=1158163 RepID=UPI00039D25CE|nr:ArsJ-associated glyceraldehyde-3-phosphate dehydrogenase [Thioalkalivibrio sp. ALMg3]
MAVRVGINGMGRIGRLALRAAWDRDDIEIVHLNEVAADGTVTGHLLEFDSVHGRWGREPEAQADRIRVDGRELRHTSLAEPAQVPWGESDVDIVIDATGAFRTMDTLEPHFTRGAKRVVVAAPVKDERALNVVMGVNDAAYDPAKHHVVTAASCTTNCLAPLVKVLHPALSIRHGTILTVHDMTATQSPVDLPRDNLRRARAAGLNLIPTTTGSAKAIGDIFPELNGRLNGHAVRVPLMNASLTDFTFEAARETRVEEVNGLLRKAANGDLNGILGYEERPLVSSDFRTDPRSSIVDAQSTMVVDGTQVKVLAWYDNEWGYANRLVELVARVAKLGL